MNTTSRQKDAIERDNKQFLLLFLIFLAILSIATFRILDFYLFTLLAILLAIVASCIFSVIICIIALSDKPHRYINIIISISAIIGYCYFSYDYINEKKEKDRIDLIERKKRYDEAQFLCNDEQRTLASNQRDLLLSNKVAKREVSGSWVTYFWLKNWWLMSEAEQHAAIRKVADIEACFSKKGFGLPTVTIVFDEANVARADPVNGPRVLERHP